MQNTEYYESIQINYNTYRINVNFLCDEIFLFNYLKMSIIPLSKRPSLFFHSIEIKAMIKYVKRCLQFFVQDQLSLIKLNVKTLLTSKGHYIEIKITMNETKTTRSNLIALFPLMCSFRKTKSLLYFIFVCYHVLQGVSHVIIGQSEMNQYSLKVGLQIMRYYVHDKIGK